MKTFSKYVENLGGGLPSQTPNYARGAQQLGTDGSMPKHINIGPAHLTVVGNALQIDTQNNEIRLILTPQQLAQLEEFSN